MDDNDQGMTREQIRTALLAKIEAAWPNYKDKPALVRSVELGSSDDLRKILALAEIMRDFPPCEPTEWVGPTARIPDEAELRLHVVRSRTGVELPVHHYVLARDEFAGFYGGPAWVPFNLWEQFKDVGDGSLVSECARKLIETPGAEGLWGAIARRFLRPDKVSLTLAIVCADALARWRVMPRDTPRDFKGARQKLARRAEQLALELERFFLPRDADKHELPGLLDFTQLLKQEERELLDQAIRIMTSRIVNGARKAAGVRGLDWEAYNADDNGGQYSLARMDAHHVYELLLPDYTQPYLPKVGVPTLPDMLRRIAAKFQEDGDAPPVMRPNLANAERNFFTRFLCKYFWTSFGDVSPAIVRDIVSIFFLQGISENDVSQIVAPLKGDHPSMADPETSPPK